MSNGGAGWRFWIDRGGTFTDLVARAPDGDLHVRKVLSEQPGRPGDPAVRAIRSVLGLAPGDPLPPGCIEEVRLGTTVATNALLERRGAPTLLLLNRGFADLLSIGDQHRPELFAQAIERPPPLHRRVLEVGGRLAADGRELEPFEPDDTLEQALRQALADGLSSVAVALLHAQRQPAHEQRLGAWLRQLGFEAVALSHEVSPLPRLVPRAHTTVVEAYVGPVLRRYLDGLQRELGPAVPLRVMQSSGALIDPGRLRAKDTLLSGPAGGLVGAVRTAAAVGETVIVGFDMGGTSTDVCHVSPDSAADRAEATDLGGHALQAPMLPLHTVAAGGGSILRLEDGRLQVGPASAGADPGPACYGRGGPLTITDANLLLGRLRPEGFAAVFGPGGDQPLDGAVVRRGFIDLAAGLGGLSPEAAAEGALAVAVEHMAEAIRRVALERGHDPRLATLCSFGGAGGQHACALAESLGMERVLLHPLAGVLSAYGIGLADERDRREHLLRRPLSAALLAELAPRVAALPPEADVQLLLRLPGHDGTPPLPMPWGSLQALHEGFARAHARRYGAVAGDAPTPLVERLVVETVRARGEAPLRQPPAEPPWPAASLPATAPVYLDGRWHGVPLLERSRLPRGTTLAGPALILEATGTLLLRPGWRARGLDDGSLLLERRPAVAPAVAAQAADPVRLELFHRRFTAIAEQMGTRLQRTSVSVNIRERLDFSCAVFDGRGGLVANAPHIPVHLGSMGASVGDLLAAVDRGERPPLQPGDAWVSNDPFHGGTHLPDLTVITPVFAGGSSQPLFFVASRGHHADVGGLTPGSMPPHSRSIDEEGLLLRNVPLLRAGGAVADDWPRRLAAGPWPVRAPEVLLADLRAQVAANRLGVERLQALVTREGADAVAHEMNRLQAAAAAAVRRVIDHLHDGSFRVDLDGGLHIAVAIRIDRGRRRACIDFSGTSPQQPDNRNAPLAVTRAVVLYVLRCLLDEAIPLNDGCFEPIDLVVPEGCLLRPRPPAAVVAGNVETSQAVAAALFAALGLQAAAQGTMNNLSFGNGDCRYYETIGGGTGAGRRPDGRGFAGADAVHSHMTNARLTDPEILEEQLPVRLEQLAIRRGSGGAGRWPGGNGMVRQLRFLEPVTVALLTGSRQVAPFGLDGGGPGAPGRNERLRADGAVEPLPGCVRLDLAAGEGLRLLTPGGGGFGAPGGRALPALLLPLLLALTPAAGGLQEAGQRFRPVASPAGMVVSQEARASAAGAAVLRQGGSAVDAAVATAFCLAVTLPQAGNLGGGGFLMVWDPQRRRAHALDFRETAPRRVRPDLYLRPDGSVDPRRTTDGLLSVAVPGSVAGLLEAQHRFGRLSRAQVLAPAIALARDGIVVDGWLAGSLAQAAPRLRRDPVAATLYLHPEGRPYRVGERLRQPELAATLARLARQGPDGFYRGPFATALAALMARGGGLIDQADLAAYRPRWREPVGTTFAGVTVLSMPPPSSGGLTLVLLLHLLEPLDLAGMGLNSAAAIHWMVEAMNLAYRDRNALLGDPDAGPLPVAALTDRGYADRLRATIDPQRHTPAERLGPPPLAPGGGGENTTHLSVADRDGGLAALTTTLNLAYGSGIAVPGTGVLLNNEIDDFTIVAGAPNAFGLRQGDRNVIAPGRRPLSSMTPTLVLDPEGRGWIATGSPGGSRIITTVLQVLLNRLRHGLNLAGAVAAPRLHSQQWPDAVRLEDGFSPDTRRLLLERGHRLDDGAAMGSANSVEVLPGGGSLGAVDPRRPEGAAVPERP
ncbi:MAG: gamma-glutamyltransferase [Prochlorococcaceae cyanobacterium]